MTSKKTRISTVLLLSFILTIGFMTGCGKKEVEEKQNPAAVKVIDGDDVEFKEPESK